MGLEVEIVFSGGAAELAVKGVAEKLHTKSGSFKTVCDFIKDAYECEIQNLLAGIDFWGNDLIPEIRETVGVAYVIGQAIDDDVVTLTY